MEQKGSTLTPAKKPAKVFANKRTMNFAAYRKSPINVKKVAIIVGVIVVVAGVFTKFAILDQLEKKNAAVEARNAAQMRLTGQMMGMANYNELKQKYDRLTDARMNENERYLVDRVEVFDMIREEIMPIGGCSVDSVSLHNNELNLGLSGLTLQELGDLINDLEELEMVTQVELRNAYSVDSDTASMSIAIKLQKEGVVIEEA